MEPITPQNSPQNITNIITNNINNQSNLKKYWCHLCKKEFSHTYSDSFDIPCIYCGKTFCEILETEDINNSSHPINFEPYIAQNNNTNQPNSNNNIQNNNSNNLNISFSIRNLRNGRSNSNFSNRIGNRIFDLLNRIATIQNYNDEVDNIINQIMINDTNKYGNPPASKNAIEKLQKCKIDMEKLKEFGIENSCAVCKEEFTVGEECLLMPCQHHFHGNCLLPWLNERNSCPVCRYELPTDDEDFEERKKQKMNANNSNLNVSNENSN